LACIVGFTFLNFFTGKTFLIVLGDGFADGYQQFIGIQGLGYIIAGSVPKGFNGRADIRIPGNNNYRDTRAQYLYFLKGFHSGYIRQAIIAQDEDIFVVPKKFQATLTGMSNINLVIVFSQEFRKYKAHVLIVI